MKLQDKDEMEKAIPFVMSTLINESYNRDLRRATRHFVHSTSKLKILALTREDYTSTSIYQWSIHKILR